MSIFNASIGRKMLAFGLILAGLPGVAACMPGANPVRDAATALGAGPKVAQTPEFIARSRPERLEYIPVGTAGPGRPTPARTADEVTAAEAEMGSVRAANEAAA